MFSGPLYILCLYLWLLLGGQKNEFLNKKIKQHASELAEVAGVGDR